MDERLLDVVLTRLDTTPLEAGAEELLFAALEGEDALRRAVGGESPPRPRHTGDGVDGANGEPPARAYLRSLTVEGFRGVGPPTTLELVPGPGLTVVCGRNGSGKSSFAEAAEVLLTGRLRRWDERSAVWREGWRCMHSAATKVSAELLIEGSSGAATVVRQWEDSENKLEGSTAWVQRPGTANAGIESLGWTDAFASYRPFLSHSELEALLAQPKTLYDQLNALLGLEDLEQAAKRLGDARRNADKQVKAEKESRTQLMSTLGASDDERASEAVSLLKADPIDISALSALATGAHSDESGRGVLLQLAGQQIPDEAEVTGVVAALRTAVRALAEAASTTATEAASVVGLLDAAMAHFDAHGPGDCPVCGEPGKLDAAWRSATGTRTQTLRAATDSFDTARRSAARELGAVSDLVRPVPPAFAHAADAGLDGSMAAAAWTVWAATPPASVSVGALNALADHLERAYPALAEAAGQLSAEASEEAARQEDRWAPLAASLAQWCSLAAPAASARHVVATAKRAETWLKAANDDVRNEQLRPFADHTVALWAELRQESNVELLRMTLAGAGNQSHVEFEVSVDGQPANGLGVMSQGEVNALALSVFLPRATSPLSPLRFVVIDDPVQAMDPSKVAGLARVLALVAQERQVVVFTHDDRLPNTIRDLDLPARILQVQRRADSVVDVIPAGDPCSRLLADAGGLTAGDRVPLPVASKVVPGICRIALETVCVEIARQRRLRRGDHHDATEEVLNSVHKLVPLLALAVLDDPERGGEVYAWLNNRIGSWATTTVQACNKGAHGAPTLDSLRGLVGDTRKLVDRLRLVAA